MLVDFNVKGREEKFREESLYEQPTTREQEFGWHLNKVMPCKCNYNLYGLCCICQQIDIIIEVFSFAINRRI